MTMISVAAGKGSIPASVSLSQSDSLNNFFPSSLPAVCERGISLLYNCTV